MKQLPPSFIKEFELQKKADAALRESWLNDILFTWQWWLLVALVVIPWLTWWKVVDRRRIFEISTYGLIVMALSTLFDAIGVESDLWEYHYQLVPLLDVFVAYDISVMPVVYMLVYQYFSSWKSFIVANIFISGLFTFASEPLLKWLGYYQLLKWEYYYSFPIYFAIAVLLKWFIQFLKTQASTSKM